MTDVERLGLAAVSIKDVLEGIKERGTNNSDIVLAQMHIQNALKSLNGAQVALSREAKRTTTPLL